MQIQVTVNDNMNLLSKYIMSDIVRLKNSAISTSKIHAEKGLTYNEQLTVRWL